MTLRVVGAGLGRTGTLSLKIALKRLLGGPCYHMAEVFGHPEHIPTWHAAARGTMPDWAKLLAGYRAAVDWPSVAFWPELSQAFPDALVLLSVRDPRSWWESADRTIFQTFGKDSQGGPSFLPAWKAMVEDLFAARFPVAVHDPEAAMAAFEQHNARVRETVPAHRLLVWQAGDGWEPLCAALRVPVPDEPFPHANTRAEWLAVRRAGSPDG